MAPPRNLRRRNVLADAAIEILGTAGIHKLSHRAVDEQGRACLPGTASNDFPRRDDLLAAAVGRVAELQLARMAEADSPGHRSDGAEILAGRADRSGPVPEVATAEPDALAVALRADPAGKPPAGAGSVDGPARPMRSRRTIAEHRALGLPTSARQVHALMTLYGGALLTLVAGPPEAVTRPGVIALARSLVHGVPKSLPDRGSRRSKGA